MWGSGVSGPGVAARRGREPAGIRKRIVSSSGRLATSGGLEKVPWGQGGGQLIPDGSGSEQGKSPALTALERPVGWLHPTPGRGPGFAPSMTPVPSTAPSSVVIGVLGGIASGKSAVAALLAGEDGVVLDADAIAREVLARPETADWLRAPFGPEVLDGEGRPAREALAQRVFADPAARERLEGWIHPAVRERIGAGLEEARGAGRSPIVLDVPLLLENDRAHQLTGECDFLVFIETDVEDRERRAQERRGWPPGEVTRRERAQIPLEEKRARARHVVENRAGLAELQARVREILEAEHLPH